MTTAITGWAFAAVKGGVGKTTLATAVALDRAARGGRVLVLELDFLGTSACDALELCAPARRVGEDGLLDLVDAAPPAWLSLADTRRALLLREDTVVGPVGVPFFNDVMLHQFRGVDDDVWIPALTWRASPDARVEWLPASPLRRDVHISAGWLMHEDPEPVVRRLADLLELIPLMYPDLTDVIFDLPPGLFGFSDFALGALGRVAREQRTATWDVRRFMVTSPDRQDLLATARTWLELSRVGLPFVPVLNRATEPELRASIAFLSERMPALGVLGFVNLLRRVGTHPSTLGAWFRGGSPRDTLVMPDEVQSLVGRGGGA
jgi:hypothetical protein